MAFGRVFGLGMCVLGRLRRENVFSVFFVEFSTLRCLFKLVLKVALCAGTCPTDSKNLRFAPPPPVVSFFRQRYASFWKDRSNATPDFTMLKLTLGIFIFGFSTAQLMPNGGEPGRKGGNLNLPPYPPEPNLSLSDLNGWVLQSVQIHFNFLWIGGQAVNSFIRIHSTNIRLLYPCPKYFKIISYFPQLPL